jgi:hypothetical protein
MDTLLSGGAARGYQPNFDLAVATWAGVLKDMLDQKGEGSVVKEASHMLSDAGNFVIHK